jgi:hypothetical protein
MFFAQRDNALKLCVSVACGHICHSIEPRLRKPLEQLVKVIILELLGLFIAGNANADVAEVCISGNPANLAHERDKLSHIGQLVGRGDVKLLEH